MHEMFGLSYEIPKLSQELFWLGKQNGSACAQYLHKWHVVQTSITFNMSRHIQGHLLFLQVMVKAKPKLRKSLECALNLFKAFFWQRYIKGV